MAPPKPVLRGENVAVSVFVDNVPYRQADLCKTVKVSESAVQHRDQYLGQSRAVTDKQVDGWDVSLEMDQADSALVDALLAQEEARRANRPVPKISVLLQFSNRDGSRNAHFVTDIQAKVEMNIGGRTDAVTQSLECQGMELRKAV